MTTSILVDIPAVMSSNRYEVTNGLPPNSGCKRFLKINFVNLLIAPGNNVSFVDGGRREMRTGFDFEDPASSNRPNTRGKWD